MADVELLGLAMQPRTKHILQKIFLILFVLETPDASLTVNYFGLALQIMQKHADTIAEKLDTNAHGMVAIKFGLPLLEVLITGINAGHHRSVVRNRHMYKDSRNLQAGVQPAYQHAFQNA